MRSGQASNKDLDATLQRCSSQGTVRTCDTVPYASKMRVKPIKPSSRQHVAVCFPFFISQCCIGGVLTWSMKEGTYELTVFASAQSDAVQLDVRRGLQAVWPPLSILNGYDA